MGTVTTLLIAGVLLILLETVLPGMVAGTVGFTCLVIGVGMAYKHFGPGTGNLVLFAVLGGLLIIGLLWVRFFPNSRLGRMFITRQTSGNLGVEQPDLLEQRGTALTNLRPSGMALINGRRIDVVTEGGLIERGTAIKVIAVEGLRVIVREA